MHKQENKAPLDTIRNKISANGKSTKLLMNMSVMVTYVTSHKLCPSCNAAHERHKLQYQGNARLVWIFDHLSLSNVHH